MVNPNSTYYIRKFHNPQSQISRSTFTVTWPIYLLIYIEALNHFTTISFPSSINSIRFPSESKLEVVLQEKISLISFPEKMCAFGLNFFIVYIFVFVSFDAFHHFQAWGLHYQFVVKEAPYSRLCSTKNILTVNGKFPGPTLYAHKGDTIIVDVYNKGNHNITIHWHGVHQPRYPWSDGPEYVTQCPIQPGSKFTQKVILSKEEGTLFWHAHSDWSRATVHGAIIIYPKLGESYPFPKPHAEVPIVLGEWWKSDVMEVLEEALATGRSPNVSDAFTINGQPGDLYPCSKPGTFKLNVEYGKTYLLRLINAGMNEMLFFSVAKHKLQVVGADASYTKPLKRKYVVISPGQTLDCILDANRDPGRYYMVARAYASSSSIPFDNTTTTAIVQYIATHSVSTVPPRLPKLPYYNDTVAFFKFSSNLRSLASENHPIQVPLTINTRLFSTVSVNTLPCPTNRTCQGPNSTLLAASMNNISFVSPSIDILQAYYDHIQGVFGRHFPSFPPLIFNFTADDQPLILEIPKKATEVKILKYNSTVEIVLQGTSLVAGIEHPMHLHGYSFYIVGGGFGNFDAKRDPLTYNLVDPPLRNTVAVPIKGWVAIRFKANNPGVWFMHCHFERHLSWGMKTVFIVENGKGPEAHILPPPPDMPPC